MNTFRFSALPAALLLTFASAATLADYQNELAVSYSDMDGDGYDQSLMLGEFTHYLATVKNQQGPLAEAAFLAKASFVTAALGYNSTDYDFGAESSGYPIGAGVQYTLPEQPVVLSASYMRHKEELESPYDGDLTTKTFTVGMGYYLDDRTLASIEYANTDFGGLLDDSANVMGVGVKHLADLGGGRALNLEGSVSRTSTDDSDSNSLAMAVDFYPRPEFSLGAGMAKSTGDDDATELLLNARAFLDAKTSLSLAFSNSDGDDGSDLSVFTLGAAVRF